MAKPVKVFVSYSWEQEKHTRIVDELEGLCRQRNIQLIRDKNEMQHGELIKEFMDQLSGGEHIITVFSDTYFRSDWCMYELLATWNKGNFKDRTHSLLIDVNCNLGNVKYHDDIISYWEDKEKRTDELLNGKNLKNRKKLYDKSVLYRDISQNIDELLDFSAGRVITHLKALKEKNFSQILDQINPVQKEPDYLADDQFLDQIKALLVQDLRKSEEFCNHLTEVCRIKKNDLPTLVEELIKQCQVSNGIEDIILNARYALFNSREQIKASDFISINNLCKAAEGVVSKLVLFNVKDDWVTQYRQSQKLNQSSHHDFPNLTMSGVDIAFSRIGKTLPLQRRYGDGSQLAAKKGELESGIGISAVKRDVIKNLYKLVVREDLADGFDEAQTLQNLNDTIEQNKKLKILKMRKNHFLIVSNDPNSPLNNKEIQEEVIDLLPDLSLIRIKAGEMAEVFFIDDTKLAVTIREFYKTLDECRS